MKMRIVAAVAVGALSFSTQTFAAITSRSYVQSGLVAQYDGINNAGHDAAHSDSAATWVDLTGNGNNATKAADVTCSATSGQRRRHGVHTQNATIPSACWRRM